jgi:hypothetical protein
MIFNRINLSRRSWNNVLIIGIAFFMLMIAAPTLIKQYLLEPAAQASEGLVLDPSAEPIEINYAGIQFYQQGDNWRAIPKKWNQDAESVVSRWKAMQGTPVDDETYQKLKPAFEHPMTIEVWYQEVEEPQRITAYPLDQFWLLNTYNGLWVAVSFEGSELLPQDAR